MIYRTRVSPKPKIGQDVPAARSNAVTREVKSRHSLAAYARGLRGGASSIAWVTDYLHYMTASSTSWKSEPFQEGIPIPYQAVFTGEEFARLKTGLIPQQMEDKWFIYYEEPHLFFHRSWTGKPVYRLTIKSTPKEAQIVEVLWSKDLEAASNADPNYQAQLVDFLLSNLLLGQQKPFPVPPGLKEPAPGVFQHSFSGSGYREVAGQAKKPWWRIW